MRRSLTALSFVLALCATLVSACGDDDTVVPPGDLGPADSGRADLGTDLGGPRDAGTDAGPVECTVGCAIVQITAGLRHTCARRENGEVLCWGNNYFRELGDDNGRHQNCPPTFDALPTDCQARPVVVVGIDDATDISAHIGPTTCGRTAAGAWKCWGLQFINTGTGQPEQFLLATAEPRLDGVTQLGPFFGGACGVTTSGGVTCLGQNQGGQLGDGTTTERRMPITIAGLTGVAEVHASGSHTCARLDDGTVRCWGSNESGQLGDAVSPHATSCRDGATTIDCATSPVNVNTIDDATALAVNGGSACVIRADGTVWCWGANHYGQLGNGTLVQSNTPVQAMGLTGVTAIAGGGEHYCALVAGGNVKCWGENFHSQLGDNALHANCPFGGESHDCASTAVDVPGITGATALALGSSHSCVLLADGVSCWGNNIVYQSGVRDTQRVMVPTMVAGIP